MIRKTMTVLMLVFFVVLLPALSFAGEVDLPKTGQTTCYDSSGSVIDCANTGQDGDIQAGVEWPEPRFEDNGDGTVTDQLTGLIWLKNANCFGERTWFQALNDSNKSASGSCGLNDGSIAGDWYLPNIVQLESLLNAGPNSVIWLKEAGFSDVRGTRYWSGTSSVYISNYAWNVGMCDGITSFSSKAVPNSYVWPVRTDQTDPVQTWKTGQTIVYATGDDGALQYGVSWPSPRFQDNGDGTITDHLTGLIWLKNANCFGERTWSQALTISNNLSSGSCGLSDGSVDGDWRLPNRKELFSLIDFSRHSPPLPKGHLFENVQSSGSAYWSATTFTNNPILGCFASMSSGGTSRCSKSLYTYYVWPVRAGQGGSLDHFIISDIDSPQTIDTPFEITITARDEFSNRVTGFNGEVYLWSSAGNNSVFPLFVTLVDGGWTGNIRIYEGGNDVYVTCAASGIFGKSDPFDVSGMSSNLGNIGGEIRDNSYNLILNSVRVSLIGTSYETIVNNGTYLFENVDSGNYWLTAEDIPTGKTSTDYFIFVPTDYHCTTKDITICFCDENDDKIPVLLVPGIMGSTDKEAGLLYPCLLKNSYEWDKDELKIHAPGTVGWKDLIEELTDEVNVYKQDCNLFEVPYDWRWDLDTNISHLKNWIDKAKQVSGKDKVNIIAHSTGGLLVRAYIQGNGPAPDYDYDFDINRFAMVGTPNMGSANAYYMWEGGDPLLVDNIVSRGISWKNFYWNTTVENYNAANAEDIHINTDRNRLKILNYYTGGDPKGENSNAIKGLKQLLPTYGFLGKQSTKPLEVIQNDILLKLNDDANTDRMGKSDSGKVETAIFLSSSKKTIVAIDVGAPGAPSDPFYKDGYPVPEDENSAFFPEAAGDGTVLESSADLPWREGWADKHLILGEHAKLVKESVSDLIEFLNGTLDFNDGTGTSQTVNQSVYTTAADAENAFSISFRGRIQPFLVDSLGNGCGINPATNLREKGMSDAVITIGPDSGNIEFTNIPSGTYSLYIESAYSEDFRLNIGLMTSEYAKKLDYHGFINSELLSYTLIVDLLSDDKVLLNHSPSPPTGLEANPYDSGSLKTKLSWEVSSDPSVISYNIYSKQIVEPHLKFVGTTTATFYETGNLWAENSTIVTRFYAVSAVKGDGTQSFLSEMIENNDRDHDGLTDQEEITYGSLVDDPDSDDDGLLDGREFSRGTNPLLADTDGDQVSDYEEIQGGSDPLDENSVPLLPCEGDFEPDGDVDGSDLAVFAADFGRTDCDSASLCEGDFDHDGDVDGSDLATFAADFGRTDCPTSD